MTVDIIHTTIHDLQSDPDLLGLLMEYSCESGMSGLPPPKWNFGTYSMMESQGFLHPIAAYVDDHLVGFLLLLVHDLPHYSVPVAVSESYFVSVDHRSTGAGLRLLHEAEGLATEMGAAGIVVSAPHGGKLDAVLAKTNYKVANTVYFRSFQ
jgi:GNAT superfamily N-acetyltransferase